MLIILPRFGVGVGVGGVTGPVLLVVDAGVRGLVGVACLLVGVVTCSGADLKCAVGGSLTKSIPSLPTLATRGTPLVSPPSTLVPGVGVARPSPMPVLVGGGLRAMVYWFSLSCNMVTVASRPDTCEQQDRNSNYIIM